MAFWIALSSLKPGYCVDVTDEFLTIYFGCICTGFSLGKFAKNPVSWLIFSIWFFVKILLLLFNICFDFGSSSSDESGFSTGFKDSIMG